MDRGVHLAVNRIEDEGLMTRVATILCAAVSVVTLSMSGAAFAQDIGCVDGMPAPPFTQICPPTAATRAFAEVPAGRNGHCAQKYRSFDAASGTYIGRDGSRHVCQ
jgi:BA14K-like protein